MPHGRLKFGAGGPMTREGRREGLAGFGLRSASLALASRPSLGIVNEAPFIIFHGITAQM